MLRLKTTPFHARTAPLNEGNAWRRWAGHSVASCYELSFEREYHALRHACALFDVSALCKYEVRGSGARDFLNRLVTRDLSKMRVGSMLYTPWCDARGKVVDDGTIACLASDLFRLTAAEPNLSWLLDNARGFDVRIVDVSDSLGALAVQGPCARDLLCSVYGESLRALPWSTYSVELGISRTGYTGDLGYEVWVPAERALETWDRLVEAGAAYGLAPAGIWALDVARIEAGLIMLGVDYSPALTVAAAAQASSPYELGLGWAVHRHKPFFVGQRALLEASPEFQLVGLVIDDEQLRAEFARLGLPVQLPFVPWRETVPVFGAGGEQVGYATCGCWSPLLKSYLALAQVDPAATSTELHIDLMVDRWRRSIGCRVARLPFFSRARA